MSPMSHEDNQVACLQEDNLNTLQDLDTQHSQALVICSLLGNRIKSKCLTIRMSLWEGQPLQFRLSICSKTLQGESTVLNLVDKIFIIGLSRRQHMWNEQRLHIQWRKIWCTIATPWVKIDQLVKGQLQDIALVLAPANLNAVRLRCLTILARVAIVNVCTSPGKRTSPAAKVNTNSVQPPQFMTWR